MDLIKTRLQRPKPVQERLCRDRLPGVDLIC